VPNLAQARADRKPENDQPSSERERMSIAEIGGRYRLEGRLGYGGMSTVHLALDLRLERQVAVKLLAEHLAEDPTFISRFQREAQAAARLVHPNIVQVFDSGQDESTGQYYIVMEYIQGQSCAEILRDDGWLDVDEAISIIDQACEGLHYAHRHGVVHRDVKPGNLLRAREGEVKLADFGIAKATEQSSITQVGSVLGTAAYLAPEQARGEDAGPRADLYALGVVTYQLISGRLPYEAASLTELALKQQQEEPPLLDTLVAAVTPQLAEAVAVSLALDPLERYQTAREMGRALSDGANGIAPGERPAARRQSPATEATSVLSGGRPTGARDAGRTAATNVTPRRPRSGPPRRTPAAAQAVEAQQPPAHGRGRRRGRLLGALVALLVIVVIVVAIVIATAPGSTQVRLRNVVYSDVQQASSALKQLVSENTK
jgi:serine/threonine protein kinase